MYLIDKTYFQRELHIPNINEPSATESLELDLSIDKYVRLFLQNILGNVLFTELDANIINGVLKIDAPQKWLNFVNGFDYDGKTWKGLIFEEGLYKTSLLANMVYLQHYQTTSSQMIGQVVNESKNAINVNPSEHLINIYNDFVEMYQGSKNINVRNSIVNGVNFTDYYSGNENGYVNLYQFITDNKADYLTASLPCYEFKNRIGL